MVEGERWVVFFFAGFWKKKKNYTFFKYQKQSMTNLEMNYPRLILKLLLSSHEKFQNGQLLRWALSEIWDTLTWCYFDFEW